MMRAFREPLLHFFLLGAAVFGLFSLFDDTPPPTDRNSIVVTAEDARRLAAEFETTWRRSPEPRELDRLIEQFVREEIYVREAMALNLDQNDPIIRQRLRLKMEFLTEAGAETANPNEATLEAHLADRAERFARPARVAFEQVMLEESSERDATRRLRIGLNSGRDPDELGTPSLLPSAVALSPRQAIDATFGKGFFDVVAEQRGGEWAGPIKSAYGQHLVRVTDYRDGGLPPLDQIRDEVLQDWQVHRAAELRAARLEAMRARYEIVRPVVSELLSQ